MAEYVIRIINETSENAPVKGVAGDKDGLGGEISESAGTGQAVASKLAKKIVSKGVILHTANQIISHQHSLISLKTGAHEYAQRANYAYQKGSSFITSVVLGAELGSAGGIGGIAAGALVGALVNIGGNALNYVLEQDRINTEKELEDISIGMRSTRATVSGRRYSNITEF